MSLQSYRSLQLLLQTAAFQDIEIVKRDILNPYYLEPLRQRIGVLANPLATFFNRLPVRFSTNFWGHCMKLKNQ